MYDVQNSIDRHPIHDGCNRNVCDDVNLRFNYASTLRQNNSFYIEFRWKRENKEHIEQNCVCVKVLYAKTL